MISILIPSYNHELYIWETLRSASSINIPDKEIIVIDDASNDNSSKIIKQYLIENPLENIKYIQNFRNKGVVSSIITFISLAKYDYLYLLSSDDIAQCTGIEYIFDRILKNNKLQFIIGGGINLLSDGKSTRIYGNRHDYLFNTKSQKEFLRRILLMNWTPLLCQSTIFKKSALISSNALDEQIEADDYAIFSKLLMHYPERDADFEFHPDVDCVHYRHHESNSYKNTGRQNRHAIKVLKACAPKHQKNRAVGYKIAFFILISLKNKDIASFTEIIKFTKAKYVLWIMVGMINHLYWVMKYK